MSNINLLPWREGLRARQKRQFLLLLAGAAALTLALMLAINLWIHRLIAHQQERNQFLQTETVRLDQVLGDIRLIKEQRAQLIERMRLIDGFQQRRNFSVRLFNQMPALVPPGVYLSEVSVAGDRLELNGKTEAYPRVASMIRAMEATPWLSEPRLSSIFASDSQPISLSQFAMQVRIRTPGGQP
ncbi:fimbrial assembly protein [Zobellella taiwanensis]|uniref:Fimbrial assembly protein n=1 Tax=Zobellella taiwanensis TaxID=347535 RepID=A0A2P7R458_9GAMM|nr:PilN domain-containing protein [Zobellella taiwanensis]PSJ44997.1 fimbrial assembly protein [Zobellella taiwanensis]